MSQNEREQKTREQIAEIEQRERGHQLAELNQQGIAIPEAVKKLQQTIHDRNKHGKEK